MVTGTSAAQHAFARQRAASTTRRATVLIAEDSADSREMLEVLLGYKGYDVLSTDDGLRAVDIALNGVPDIILVDLSLPALDGLAVARELRQHPELERVPIIIVSGYDASRYRDAALAAGCDDYLTKPIDFDRLDQILETIKPLPFPVVP